MHRRDHRRHGIARTAAVGVLATVALGSCAIRPDPQIDLFAFLPASAVAYAFAPNETGVELLLDLFTGAEEGALDPILERTTSMAAAIETIGAHDDSDRTGDISAVFAGSFSTGRLGFALSATTGWSRRPDDRERWESVSLGFVAWVPQRGYLSIATRPRSAESPPAFAPPEVDGALISVVLPVPADLPIDGLERLRGNEQVGSAIVSIRLAGPDRYVAYGHIEAQEGARRAVATTLRLVFGRATIDDPSSDFANISVETSDRGVLFDGVTLSLEALRDLFATMTAHGGRS